MKKFFSLVLALVMALSLTTVAWGATYEYITGASETEGVAGQLVTGEWDGANATLELTTTPGTYDAGVVLQGNATVKNVKIVGYTRGIESGYEVAATTITIDNVVVEDCVRAMHINTAATADLYVSNSTFEGKISFDIHGGTAKFVNCTFKYDSVLDAAKGNMVESYDNVVFEDCVFEEGFELSFENFAADDEMALDNCTYAGEPVTETNFARLFGLSAADAAKVTSVATDVSAATYDLYEGDGDLYLDGAFRTKVAAKKLTKTQAGQVAGWDIEGTLYVEITKAEATNGDYYLTNAGKEKAIMYLREAENYGVYTLTGKTYSNFGDDYCGEWNMDPDTTNMYVDADGDFYFAGTQAYMLVGNSVVGVSPASDADYANYYIDHQMEGVYNAKDVLVGVKCVVCGATGTVYASADKAPIGADVYYFDGAPYVLDKVAVKPSTDKVQSAETFDAGIAMYVGMSVLAATGSAVVLKKRER